MTREEIRLRALELASTHPEAVMANAQETVERAQAYADFLEGRVTLASGLDEAVAKIDEPWPDTIARDPGANPFKPHAIGSPSDLKTRDASGVVASPRENAPAVEIRVCGSDGWVGHVYKVWADGRAEGFPAGSQIINRIPNRIAEAVVAERARTADRRNQTSGY